MGNIWKKVNLSGQSGYWALFDENTLEPIDLDEDGNIKVYKNPNDTEPVAFGTNPRAVGGIRRERDDKFAAQERARQIDEKVNRNQGALADLFGNMLTFGMTGEVTEGADNLKQGNYLKGTAQVLSPLMFMSGPLGIAARAGIGTYNLANENGVRKTWNLASQGRYGRAALSGLGDLLNAGMAIEGLSHIPRFLENAAIRYGTGAVRQWGQRRTAARAINEGIGDVQSTSEPTTKTENIEVNNPSSTAVTVNGRKPYQKPESSNWMLLELEEPLMAESPKLSRGQFETLFNSGRIKEEKDLYKYMTKPLARRIFNMASKVKKALGRFSSSNLNDKKDLQFYNAVLERSTQGLKGTKGTSNTIRKVLAAEKAETPEGQYDLYLNNEDALALEKVRRQTQRDYGTQINFNEFLGGILSSQNIPKAVAVTPIEIPGVGKFPLMERYLHNARERAELLLPDLIRKGYMYVDPNTKMWVGRYNIKDNPKPIDPSLFVLSFINNIRNSSNRVPVFREYSRAGTRELVLPIAWHGTPMGDKPLFTQYKNPTNIRPIFTTVSDGMPGSSNVKQAYQRGGTSIPFLFKRPTYNGKIYLEIPYSPINEGGSKSTGYILKDGTSIGLLMDHFSGGKGGGTARYVYEVSDLANLPGNSPQPQTEYIFGVGTPEVKSLLNTGDYLPYFNELGNPIEGVTPFNKRGGKITINNL